MHSNIDTSRSRAKPQADAQLALIVPASVTASRSRPSGSCACLSVCDPVPCRVKIDYRPVHMKPLDNEMEYVPPKPRVY